jgi:hypothetical protein
MKESTLDGQIWSAHVVTVEGHRSVDGFGRSGKANPGQSSQNRASVRLSVRTIGIESSPPIGVCKAVALGTESHNALHRFTLNSCEIMKPSRSQPAENIVQKKQSSLTSRCRSTAECWAYRRLIC